MPIVEDHVHARRVLRQIIDAEELHDRGALSAATARIELPDTKQLGGRTPTAGLAHSAADHGWKAVEVLHLKPLWLKGKIAFACVRIDVSETTALRDIFGMAHITEYRSFEQLPIASLDCTLSCLTNHSLRCHALLFACTLFR
jgi:hypothetical protein